MTVINDICCTEDNVLSFKVPDAHTNQVVKTSSRCSTLSHRRCQELFSPIAEHFLSLYCAAIFLGLGFCCIYVPSVVIVGHYFQIRRQLAMGLAAAGFGAGNFIFAPIL